MAQKRSGSSGKKGASSAGTGAAPKKKRSAGQKEPQSKKQSRSGSSKATSKKTSGKKTTSSKATSRKAVRSKATDKKTAGKKQNRKIRKVAPPRRHERQKGRHYLLYGIFSSILILVAVVVGSLVFFKVDTVTAEGFTRYTEEEITQASGIQTGENLFLLDKNEIVESLESQLPYLKDISIHWKLPGTVRITGVESQPVAALEVSNGWWYMDETGRLLEFSEEPGTLVQVSGLNLLAPSVGTDLAVDLAYQTKRDSLVQLLTAMTEQSLIGEAKSIDLSSTTEIYMEYGDRFQVKIGLSSDFDYKMRAMAGMIEQLSESEKGTIDLTMENEWHFIPG